MTINYTGSVSFTKIRNEFAGYSGSVKLSNYRIGGGFTANHENNAAIPTSNSNLALSKWWKSDKDFESNAGMGYTGSATWTTGNQIVDNGTTTGLPWPDDNYQGFITNIDLLGVTIGTVGVIDNVGTSKSTTTQTPIEEVYDAYFGIGGTGLTTFAVTGNYTGTWWDSITSNSRTLLRSTTDIPNGTYDSGANKTWWSWDSGPYLGSRGPFGWASGASATVTISMT